MIKIGLLSDTHSYMHASILEFFSECSEIWHAGDIGNIEVIEQLEKVSKVRAVYGNIDPVNLRKDIIKNQIFEVEGVKVYMTHIGGYPGRYYNSAKKIIEKEKPALFISGHSHILKVINDPIYNLLHMNPGAAGKSGFHKKITAIRFEINDKRFENLEILEVPR
jgi:putative phosphoesterase